MFLEYVVLVDMGSLVANKYFDFFGYLFDRLYVYIFVFCSFLNVVSKILMLRGWCFMFFLFHHFVFLMVYVWCSIGFGVFVPLFS